MNLIDNKKSKKGIPTQKNQGVRGECPLPPIIFTVYIDIVKQWQTK
jgi:hypothetical protein